MTDPPHPGRMKGVRAGEVVNVLLWSVRDGNDEHPDWARVVRVTDKADDGVRYKADGLIPRACLANYSVIHRMNEAAVMLRATLRLQARYRARLVQRFLIKEARAPTDLASAGMFIANGLSGDLFGAASGATPPMAVGKAGALPPTGSGVVGKAALGGEGDGDASAGRQSGTTKKAGANGDSDSDSGGGGGGADATKQRNSKPDVVLPTPCLLYTSPSPRDRG